MAATGRPRKSKVWTYFTYDKETNKCVCTVKLPESTDGEGVQEKICGYKLNGVFPTNLRKHLRSHHKAEFSKLTEMEEEGQKKESSRASQSTLTSCLTPAPTYDTNSQRYNSITTKLALCIGGTNLPFSLVENELFQEFVHELNPAYKIPQRKKMGTEIEKLYTTLKTKLKLVVNNASRISFCVDIWTKPGMTAAFLGVTAHFYTKIGQKRHQITLAVKRFSSPHSGERIVQALTEVLMEWDIPDHKIFRTITDNASNMICAFREEACIREDEDEAIEDKNESEAHIDELMEDEASQSCASNEIDQFETMESDHCIAFIGWHRISCFIHTLQLVVKNFEVSPAFKTTLQQSRSLVHKFNKSCKATEKLIELAGKKLVSNCPTRWDSTFLMLSRLLDLKNHIVLTTEDLGWQCLSTGQWKQLETILTLLGPFAHHTNVASAAKTTTMGMVIPILRELEIHLEEMKEISGIASISEKMLQDLRRRFQFALDTTAITFDPIYVTATLLNPSYCALLNDQQLSQAKKFLLELMQRDKQTNTNEAVTESHSIRADDEPPVVKRFKHLDRVSLLLEQEENAQRVEENRRISEEENELETYLKEKPKKEELSLDPFDYWVHKMALLPILSNVACEIHATPASSASVERVFSFSGEVTKGKRNRLNDYNLEREVLLQKNKEYI